MSDAARALTFEALPGDAPGPGRAAHFRTIIPPDWVHFEGHFPGHPVLAGAIQLHELVSPCLALACPQAPPPSAWLQLKFPARILPGDTLTVSLDIRDGTPDVRFRIVRDTTVCAQGTARLDGGDAP